MTSITNEDRGRSANRRGQARQRECAAWLRESRLFPGARHVGQFPGDAWQSDLSHVGPRVVEVTVVPWDKIPGKLRQSESAARNTESREFFVWKHVGRGANESGNVSDSVVITRARVMWPLLRELDDLRAFARGRTGEWTAFRAERVQERAS